jgi:cell division protein FtsN
MARDYKHRAQGKKTASGGRRSPGLSLWRVLAVIAVILMFIGLLAYLHLFAQALPTSVDTEKKTTTQPNVAQQEKKPSKPDYPHFEFYHSLSKKEIVIPEHEVKTRSREELVGKAKDGKYMMQAGSFKSTKEAEQLTKKLAAMGIQAKIDKVTVKVNKKTENAKLDPKTWYRVKIGPYSKMSSVDAIKSRLKKSGVDVMVTQLGD